MAPKDMDLAGRRITVMGLGRHGGGVAAARWLVGQGAQVTVTDLANAASLADSIAQLSDLPVARWTLGRHDETDFTAADAVVVNPAVRPDHPLLALARSQGVALTSEIELFLDRCPAAVIAVTGSNGKSTTALMLAAIFAHAGWRTWLGGNIGVSLLDRVDEIQPGDCVVLELSSFQLAHLTHEAKPPQVAVMTNCTPNHLDWHGSWEAYAAAKRRLLEILPAGGFAVIDPADELLRSWTAGMRAELVPAWPLERVPPLAVPGVHNRRNAALAAAAAEQWRVGVPMIASCLGQFTGLAHRCQALGQVAGRWMVDDSKSTTPEATRAALAQCSGPAWLLLGGQDKGSDFEPLLAEVAQRAAGAACYGSVGGSLSAALQQIAPGFPTCKAADLAGALAWCWERSAPGDTILLSPACASLDQFRDFEHRAEEFRRLVDARRPISTG